MQAVVGQAILRQSETEPGFFVRLTQMDNSGAWGEILSNHYLQFDGGNRQLPLPTRGYPTTLAKRRLNSVSNPLQNLVVR